MSPLTWLRRRWVAALILVAFVAAMAWLARSAIQDGQERRASRARIEASAKEAADLAKQVQTQNVVLTQQGERLERLLAAVESATSAEARARGDAALAFAIAELRRSIDCAELDDEATYPACVQVAARMDAIRAGEDPFAQPPTTTPTTGDLER